ncbi:MAG TPA: hypothetical protein PLF71_01385 [bacterium]|nr:hypothetical protein [bacterium]
MNKGDNDAKINTASRKSCFYQHGTRSIRDLLVNYDLRNLIAEQIRKAYRVINIREIKQPRTTTTTISQLDDEYVMLMEELGLAHADWRQLNEQTHRSPGRRLIHVEFHGEKVCDFVNRLIGRTSLIKPQAIKIIVSMIKDLMDDHEGWCQFFIERDVPVELLMIECTKEELLNIVFLTYASTGDKIDEKFILRTLNELMDPIYHDNNKEKSSDMEKKLTKILDTQITKPFINYNQKSKVKIEPFCFEENGNGFLKYYKQGKNIKIGKSDSKHYLLLQLLLDPFGVKRTIDSVYEAISNNKRKKQTTTNQKYVSTPTKIRALECVKKELQRGGKISKLKIVIERENIWLESLT